MRKFRKALALVAFASMGQAGLCDLPNHTVGAGKVLSNAFKALRSPLQEGLYVAKVQNAAYNVATGGSTITVERFYLTVLPFRRVVEGFGNAALRGRIQVSDDAVTVLWDADRPPTVLRLGPGGSGFAVGQVEYRKVEKLKGLRLAGLYTHARFQTTGAGPDTTVRLLLSQDGTFRERGLSTLRLDPNTVNAPMGPERSGRYVLGDYSLTLQYTDGASLTLSGYAEGPTAKNQPPAVLVLDEAEFALSGR
jgi:hypothetical protein